MSHNINKAINSEIGPELHPRHGHLAGKPQPGSCKIKLASPAKLPLDKNFRDYSFAS
jgi:hypothetical protein